MITIIYRNFIVKFLYIKYSNYMITIIRVLNSSNLEQNLRSIPIIN
jgi:hypothetical protein